MLYLVQTFAAPLLLALAGGLAVGWVTSDREDQGPSPWAALAMTGFALMVVAAALNWLPGRPGLWLDTVVLFGAAYLLGCIVGAFARVFTDKAEEAATEPLQPLAAAGQALAAGTVAVKAVAGSAPAVSAGALAASEAMAQGSKPQGVVAPRSGKADELELIRGIGPQNEARLHALGIYHFDQIAAWTPKEAQWVGGYLAFPGRIEREDWIGQARVLAAGGTTSHADRVKRGEIASTPDRNPPAT
jgi:predicted flap endonuclease-1-like 5' DNA nuclease